jgi:hypothetical protein
MLYFDKAIPGIMYKESYMLRIILNVVSVLVLIFWLIAFSTIFYKVDYPIRHSRTYLFVNIVQAIFCCAIPIGAMINVSDRTKPQLERRAFGYYLLSILALIIIWVAFSIYNVIVMS